MKKPVPISMDDAYARFPEAMAAYDAFAWVEPAPDMQVPGLTWPMTEREAQARGDSDASFFDEEGGLVVRSISSDTMGWNGVEWVY